MILVIQLPSCDPSLRMRARASAAPTTVRTLRQAASRRSSYNSVWHDLGWDDLPAGRCVLLRSLALTPQNTAANSRPPLRRRYKDGFAAQREPIHRLQPNDGLSQSDQPILHPKPPPAARGIAPSHNPPTGNRHAPLEHALAP